MREEDSLTAQEMAFLNVVIQNPRPSFYGVRKELGWSVRQTGQTLDALGAKGMIISQNGTGKTGTPAKFLSLTQEAQELLGIALAPIADIGSPGTPTGANQTKPLCQHHWTIQPANGPTSQGECARCHTVREFQNSIPDIKG